MSGGMASARGGAGGHGLLAGVPTVVWILLGAALVLWVLISRFRGQPLSTRRLLMLPAVLTVIGLVETARQLPGANATAVLLLAAGAACSLALGAARGASVRVYGRGGVVWQRYRPATLVWWLVLVAVKIGIGVWAHAAGAPLAQGSSAILLMVGLTFLGEAAVVAPRALASGLPFATRRSRPGSSATTSRAGAEEETPVPSWRTSVRTLAARANTHV